MIDPTALTSTKRNFPPRRSWGGIRFPEDRLAVAAVLLTSMWLWWVGTIVGTVFAIVSLIRRRGRPDSRDSRRWARAALILGAAGVAAYVLIGLGPTVVTVQQVRIHSEDSAAKSSLVDLVGAYSNQRSVDTAGFPVSSGGQWTLSGGSRVRIVPPQTASTGFKVVSAETWDVSDLTASPTGLTLYAAVLSGSGTCYFIDDANSKVLLYSEAIPLSCTADSARDATEWSSDPTTLEPGP